MQLPNNGEQCTEHPHIDHFGPFPLQQVAVLHHQLAEVDVLIRAAAVPVRRRAPSLSSRLLGREAKLRTLDRVDGPSSRSRLAARPSCVNWIESTGPSSSFRLAASPSCIHMNELTGPSSSSCLLAQPSGYFARTRFAFSMAFLFALSINHFCKAPLTPTLSGARFDVRGSRCGCSRSCEQ